MTHPAASRVALLIALLVMGASALWLRHSHVRAGIAGATGVRRLAFTAGLKAEPQPTSTRRWVTPRWPVPIDAPALSTVKAVFVRALTDTSVVVLAKGYRLQRVTDSGAVTPMPSIDEALRMTTLPVTDMRPGPGGTIWLCNPSGQAVVVSASTGTVTNAYRDGCYKVAPLPDGGAVFLGDPRADEWLEVIGSDGTTMSKGGPILDNQPDYGRAALDGEIVDAAGMLVHIPHHLGFVAAFNRHGSLQYLMTGMETDPLPQVKIAPGQVGVDRPPSSWWQQDLVAREGFIVSLVARSVKGAREAGLDLYDARTGQYVHSVKLPSHSTGMALLPHATYTIESGGLVLRKVDWREALALR